MDVQRRGEIWDEIWAEYDERQHQRAPVQPLQRTREIPAVSPPRRVIRPMSRPVPRAAPTLAMPTLAMPTLAMPTLAMPTLAMPVQEMPVREMPVQDTLVREVPGLETSGGEAPARRLRPVTAVAVALLAVVVMLAAWMALPWMLAARLSVPLGQGDAPALLREFDSPATLASLRAGLAAEADRAEGEGARRFLAGLAGRMADSWERPEAVAAWLALRSRGGRFEGSPVPVSVPRSARPTGLGSFRLEYGPTGEADGVAFDMAWQGDGFRVTGVRFLNTVPAPVTYVAVPAGFGPDRRQVAMR